MASTGRRGRAAPAVRRVGRSVARGPRSRPRPGFATPVAVAVAMALAAAGGVVACTRGPETVGDFGSAAADFGVPPDVLLGVSYLESRWDGHGGEPSTSGGYGPLHLTDERSSPASDRVARAAALTGATEAQVRSSRAANIRGGAALLADFQRAAGGPVGTGSDPADWYGAVARYSAAATRDAAEVFADEVYAVMGRGATRTTDDGGTVTLAAHPVVPRREWLARLGLPDRPGDPGAECPAELACDSMPAPLRALPGGGYGNYDLSNRPANQRIRYIVIHDTEGPWDTTLEDLQERSDASWHYTVRSNDGHVAQHVPTRDVAWHAGNWYVGAASIGIEHEGYAAKGTWYTEALYRSSARLVRYLAARFGVPLDREHVVGHDNVPSPDPAHIDGMHWDPGPYWDWSHYFELLGSPLRATADASGGLVTLDPDMTTNRPAFLGCDGPGTGPCPLQGSSAVLLRKEPSDSAPLVDDIGRRPHGEPSTMDIADDHAAYASAGLTFVVAGRRGDWTAIWYLGQKAWFRNPSGAPTALPAAGDVVTPRPGRESIPVFGRAYPEPSAYPPEIPPEPLVALPYMVPSGQRYAVAEVVTPEYYRSKSVDLTRPGDGTVVRGAQRYVQIRYGNRFAYVKADDVVTEPSGAPAG